LANRAITDNRHVSPLHEQQSIHLISQSLDLFIIVVDAVRPKTVSLPTLHFLQTNSSPCVYWLYFLGLNMSAVVANFWVLVAGGGTDEIVKDTFLVLPAN
jgi:hypothetical protein